MYIFTIQDYKPSILVLCFLSVLIIISTISIGIGCIPICVHHRVFYVINGVLMLLIFLVYLIIVLIFMVKRSAVYTAVGKFWGHKDFKFDYWIENQLQCCGYPKRNNTACDKRLYTCDVVFEYKFKKRVKYISIIFILIIFQLAASIVGFVYFHRLNNARVEADSAEQNPEPENKPETTISDSKLIPEGYPGDEEDSPLFNQQQNDESDEEEEETPSVEINQKESIEEEETEDDDEEEDEEEIKVSTPQRKHRKS